MIYSTDLDKCASDPLCWIFKLNTLDYYLYKIKYLPAKRVRGETSFEGSNPSLSATRHHTRDSISGFLICRHPDKRDQLDRRDFASGSFILTVKNILQRKIIAWNL